jgi:ATP-dependent DNA ligase
VTEVVDGAALDQMAEMALAIYLGDAPQIVTIELQNVERLYMVKFDGYRMQIHKAGDRVILHTRNGADWTGRSAQRTRGVGCRRLHYLGEMLGCGGAVGLRGSYANISSSARSSV